jgi:hypothetical protein
MSDNTKSSKCTLSLLVCQDSTLPDIVAYSYNGYMPIHMFAIINRVVYIISVYDLLPNTYLTLEE